MSKCTVAPEDSTYGHLGVDYVGIYKCVFNENGLLFFPCLLAWAAFLAYLLGHTADAYFSPTLATLSDKLKLTYDVAGVTFLALGNGAPDVFSAVAAFSSKDPSVVLIGVCELLGGAVFVTTVVVGAVSILHPASVRPQAFVRDITFQVLANLLLTVSALHGRVTVGLAFVYLAFYALYVLVVIYLDRAQRRKAHAGGLHLGGEEMDNTGVMSAFWFTPNDVDEFHRATERATVHKLQHDFLLLDEDEMSSDEEEESEEMESFVRSNAKGSVDRRKSEENGNATKQTFSHLLLPGYFEGEGVDGRGLLSEEDRASSRIKSRPPRPPSPYAAFNTSTRPDRVYDADDSTLSIPLSVPSPHLNPGLSNGQPTFPSNSSESNQAENGNPLPPSRPGPIGRLSSPPRQRTARSRPGLHRRRSSVWDNMYWQQWRWRRKLQRDFWGSDFWDRPLWGKVLKLVEAPVVLLRNLTIPLVEEDSWSRFYVSLVPCVAPIFVMYITGLLTTTFGKSRVHVWPFVETTGIIFGIVISLTTHEHRPPRSFTYSMALTSIGFIMCAAWIYTIASELVAVIETLGTLWNIPSSLLGLTMMAWGNSAGDLITNIAVARAGLSDMAVAGCFAGPTFNMLVGLGLSFFVKCATSGSFALEFDQRAYICLTFLYLGLGLNLGIAFFSGFRLGKGLAVPLLALYTLSSVLQVSLMLGGIIQ